MDSQRRDQKAVKVLQKYEISTRTNTIKHLTHKQRLFVEEYLVDLNATRAAIRAGYSKGTAGSIGHENLKKPEIVDAIRTAYEGRLKRTTTNSDYVLREAKLCYERLRDNDDLRTARLFLEIVGKHTDVRAFDNSLSLQIPPRVVRNYLGRQRD